MSHIKNRPIFSFRLPKKQVVVSMGLANLGAKDSSTQSGTTTKVLLFLLICFFACLWSGCSAASMDRPIWELALPGYKPLASTEPHATLVVSRSTPFIFVHIDGALVKDDSLTLRLDVSPGTHKVSFQYSSYPSYTTPIKRELKFKEGTSIAIDAWLESGGIAVRISDRIE